MVVEEVVVGRMCFWHDGFRSGGCTVKDAGSRGLPWGLLRHLLRRLLRRPLRRLLWGRPLESLL